MASGAIPQPQNNSGSGYCKMPDGTLMQWGQQEVAIQEVGRHSVNVTYQIPFNDTPHIFTNVRTGAPEARISSATGTATSATLYVYVSSGAVNLTIDWLAIGRWK